MSERYWEERWRTEKAENIRLLAEVEQLRSHISHLEAHRDKLMTEVETTHRRSHA